MTHSGFCVLAEHPLPKPIDLEFAKLRDDGRILYYFPESEPTHGYQLVDPESGGSECYSLPNPPTDTFGKEELGKVVIRVGILEALDRMVELTEDTGATRDGW